MNSNQPPPPSPATEQPPPLSTAMEGETVDAKPWWKRWWGIALIILGLFILIGIFTGDPDETEEPVAVESAEATEAVVEEAEPEPAPEPEPEPAPEPEPEPAPEPEPEPELTRAQENALGSARSYLEYAAFSRSGLIGQLEFEEYSTEDATFAVDALDVDWNEQAAKSAESYLDYSSFSRSGLVTQLEFEGFSQEQAEYGVTQTGL